MTKLWKKLQASLEIWALEAQRAQLVGPQRVPHLLQQAFQRGELQHQPSLTCLFENVFTTDSILTAVIRFIATSPTIDQMRFWRRSYSSLSSIVSAKIEINCPFTFVDKVGHCIAELTLVTAPLCDCYCFLDYKQIGTISEQAWCPGLYISRFEEAIRVPMMIGHRPMQKGF